MQRSIPTLPTEAGSGYETNEMEFSARSANNRAVFGLLLAIKHR
jgi:hypothetical protein